MQKTELLAQKLDILLQSILPTGLVGLIKTHLLKHHIAYGSTLSKYSNLFTTIFSCFTCKCYSHYSSSSYIYKGFFLLYFLLF